jgi:penicillin-binding protein 1A
MGYTPQLLCGVWAGCDDRFIRFSSTTNGQGASAALPVWAYFYNKVEHDKTLPYSDKPDFVKPDVGIEQPNFDYTNDLQTILGAQGNDVGNGQSQDYEQGYDDTHPQNIAPESDTHDIYNSNQSPTGENAQPLNDNNKPPANKKGADTSQKPKAVMPKKGGGK